MRDIDITELGNPNVLIKKEIIRKSYKWLSDVTPKLEQLLNQHEVVIHIEEEAQIPDGLFQLDLSFDEQGMSRFYISQADLDLFFCQHLNLPQESDTGTKLTESHRSFFIKLCKSTWLSISQKLNEPKVIENHSFIYNVNFRYVIMLGNRSFDMYISINDKLARFLSNNIVQPTVFNSDDIKNIVLDVPTEFDVVLMKGNHNVDQLNALKVGNFLPLKKRDHVEVKVNKHKILDAQLIVNDSLQLGVKYE